ncbi:MULTISPECIES: polysaccharide biosynthesis tyrosine autokinase [Photobacterium]|uniref:polysaccharide biosynthesis tyrosine autokinase n=1 Tax=Photobacterium TaxID=657 RepID=UPI001E4EC082|nr:MULTISPECIES: polysaccharide biosynthesis tyrosine autokinase [Photobacterium]MCD9477020.1 polysaccharide biosynthesis tyrosine autokinase [Photobacterium phosphoreum]MCD9486603.1 polysaccharide biosynthesis tyrosine autokinase [Photobacterium iliopiscarium]MCD9508536.1 polysaccharide biosynthesis tyrosine autokinase [Photobacterium phosphoreum]MCD9529087.1 polysaccharide biosynthesis tyrosine autokinase [Photobacterium carnosum]MCD9539153.1 polysaccharide biosynthesis tyrosine autokinase [
MSIAQNTQPNTSSGSDEIDLGKLFGILIDSRWLIIITTFIFALIGISYALLATPIYKADALIQIEQKSTGMPALGGDMAEMFGGSESSATTEIEIIKSRMVLGDTVDKLNLTTVATPIYTPVFGKGLARLLGDSHQISVSRFTVPANTVSAGDVLTITNSAQGEYSLANSDGRELLTGKVGTLATNNGYSLFVTQLIGSDGATFSVSKISRLNAIQALQKDLSIAEQGKQTGILQLSMTGENRAKIKNILNDISQTYFLQNVARNSAEAENSLVFLKQHLPKIKQQLTLAEDKLNRYRQQNESVDLPLEAKTTLDTMVTLEAQLNQLTFKESDISQLYTKEHPAYVALLDKRKTLMKEKARLNKRIEKLPKTQRAVLRLTRDVEVNQQIYVQLLNKVQELSIVKASTVGNVRILDNAQAYSQAVKPKKSLIVVLATLLGGMLAVAIVLLRAALHRGVENPDEIEALGLPVYASIPLSDSQSDLDKKYKLKKQHTINETLLTIANPADLSIEALRSLRTSLHFAMMEARNNIVMISGPSPSIGKSFVTANMAAVMAKGGQRVLIIDADMRKGKMERQMCVDSKPGLADYLSGQQTIEQVIKSPGVEHLDFIARGAVPPNPSELLMHPRLKTLLDWASENYDLVLVDTPPILAVTDPAIVGAHAGTTMIVARFGLNPVKEIEVTKNRFEQNGIEVKGCILNAVERKASSTYGGNYGYYNYSYASDKK